MGEDEMAASSGSDRPDQPGLDGAADQVDLRESLSGLSHLATGRLGLENTLTQVAQFAVRAIPGADGAGLTLLEEGRSDTIVATAQFVSDIDDIQYGLGQGPCVSAAAEGRTMMSDSLGSDQRWPEFGSKVAGLGVHSALSLPLITAGRVVGAMNIYAHRRRCLQRTCRGDRRAVCRAGCGRGTERAGSLPSPATRHAAAGHARTIAP